MKIRILLSALALLSALSSWAVTDTVAAFLRPDSVAVRATADALSVTVDGRRYGDPYHYTYSTQVDSADNSLWNINLPFTRSQTDGRPRRKVLSIVWARDLYVGAALAVDAEKGMRAGWEIGMQSVAALAWRTFRGGPEVALGMGLGYRSANVGNGYCLGQADRILYIHPWAEGVDKATSRLHLFRLHMPLTVTQHIAGGVSLRVGAVLNLNTYMSATTKVRTADTTTKSSYHSLRQRFATIDLYGALSLCSDVGVYVRYSPSETFCTGTGPRYKALSFGITLGF